ncbi:MAG TPA: phosphatase PAP2 family protein [Micromonosporaceae bacterium]|nr:phosphatase PAP2 family protein [Micromonosporaceae bacterium]
MTSVTVNRDTSAQDATTPRGRSAEVRLLVQAGVIAAAVAAYFLVRGATESAAADAVRNARQVVDVERALGLYHEPGLQAALAASPAVRTVLNWVYIWGHWPVIVVTLVWLARRSPEVFRRTRNAMMASGGIGLVLFALFPVAPPRLADLGMADTVSLTSHSYRVLQPAAFTNQYAAMPSLHVGWNLLIGLAVVLTARHLVLRVAGVVMPVAMVLAVVLTANHYIVDALAGAALTVACWYLVAQRPAGRHRTRHRSRQEDLAPRW